MLHYLYYYSLFKIVKIFLPGNLFAGLLQVQPNFHACRAVNVNNSVFLIFCGKCSLHTHRSFHKQVTDNLVVFKGMFI